MAARGNVIQHSTTLVVEDCPVCGILHAIPTSLRARALEHSQAAPGATLSICCPAGHWWSYTGKNEAQQLKEQLDRERAARTRIEARNDQLRAEVRHQENRANGYKGQLARTKKRIGKGVCPCCNRHFANVEQHMASQHPDYGGAS